MITRLNDFLVLSELQWGNSKWYNSTEITIWLIKFWLGCFKILFCYLQIELLTADGVDSLVLYKLFYLYGYCKFLCVFGYFQLCRLFDLLLLGPLTNILLRFKELLCSFSAEKLPIFKSVLRANRKFCNNVSCHRCIEWYWSALYWWGAYHISGEHKT